MSAPPRPAGRAAPTRRRALGPDVARGLMLWVIAVANITVWIWSPGPVGGPRARPLGEGATSSAWTADDAVNLGMSMLVDGRGFPLFSFLVGYGVGQIAARETARGAAPAVVRALLLRRYGWLLPIGAVHACLLFPGDIITAYALGGLALALLVADSTRLLLGLAGVGTVLMALYGAAAGVIENPPAAFPSLLAPSAGQWLADGLLEGVVVVGFAPFQLLGLFPMMLLGLALSRRRVLEDPAAHRRALAAGAAAGIAAGLVTGAGTGLLTTGMLDPATGGRAVLTGADAVAGAAQGIGYALVVALVCDRALRRGAAPRAGGARAAGAQAREELAPAAVRAREHPLLWALQALGRRSMSGYLAQSVLYTLLLPPFALGLGRSLDPVAALFAGTAVWLLTLLGAVLLERRGLPGPAEALHRRLHLGQRIGS
ncbi:DUF418 domain-containing protein [Kocuria sp. U4B]